MVTFISKGQSQNPIILGWYLPNVKRVDINSAPFWIFVEDSGDEHERGGGGGRRQLTRSESSFKENVNYFVSNNWH